MWVERQDTSKSIILCGDVATAGASSEVEEKVSETEKSWNIIASPSVDDLDLQEKFTETDITATDQIIVPTAGAPKNYTYKDGKWGYDGTVEVTNKKGEKVRMPARITDDTKVPAGTGFWYLRGGDAKTINW